ncbi:MAG: class I SAM-dependent methyltransferase [Leadbetterella sp.]
MKIINPYPLDDPKATIFHRDIILGKPFLKAIYTKWYGMILSSIGLNISGNNLEIGSGAGFFKDLNPNIITSDILALPYIDMEIDAQSLPFQENELDSISMINVFHHIPNPNLFLEEAYRTLKSGGKIIMIEPANTMLGRFIYKNFHHEPFDEKGDREIAPGNPLSNSNQALPFIYLKRDKHVFQSQFPKFRIEQMYPHSPFNYILSGGLSKKSLVPEKSFQLFDFIERIFKPLNGMIGLFYFIVITKE